MTYRELEQSFGISAVSPEAYYAEKAWNAAIREMRRLVHAVHSAGLEDWMVTLDSECDGLDTGE